MIRPFLNGEEIVPKCCIGKILNVLKEYTPLALHAAKYSVTLTPVEQMRLNRCSYQPTWCNCNTDQKDILEKIFMPSVTVTKIEQMLLNIFSFH